MEREIRTNDFNLLMCKMKLTEDNQLCFEIKNGKRVENLPLEVFVKKVNDFTDGKLPKLHIAS